MRWPWLKSQPERAKERKPHRNRKQDAFYHSKQWRQYKKHYFNADPMHLICAKCYEQGRVNAPKRTLQDPLILDHIVPRHQGGPDFPDFDGVQALCRSCHAKKSGREAHGKQG